jgi:serine/threonine protein kinase
MPDLIGNTLGHYRITEKIGAGGMGEVYRAHDERLDRDVAIKVLPEEVAGDSDRLARFEREAKVLASLNQANIATLFGLEDHDGHRFLVMELVEGESLASRIARGAIPTAEVLPIALQITEALEVAHERSIVHRDLKPANVMLTSAGKIKVLDFGLAKALHPDGTSAASPESMAESPTFTADVTRAGTILGTAAYMSPEQARGQAVDARADIWAFGVVLWEMLTGRRLFEGEAVSDVLAAVLRDEPDWEILPDNIPPGVGRLLRRCLRRDPARRLRHIGDARLELEEAAEEPAFAGSGDGPGFIPAETGSERTWPLTTDVCRHLNRETLDSSIIGDDLSYLDNDRPSDVLVVYVPGLGFGHRTFEEVLRRSPYRGIAVTLYGFEESRSRRMRMPIADHLTILRLFLLSIVEALRPRTTVLAGFSAGADIVLRTISEGGVDHNLIDGVLSLSPNVNLETCFFTRLLAHIPDKKDEKILDIAREVAGAMDTPQAWLQMNPYLMELVRKFHADVDALRSHGKDLMDPFLEEGESPFAGWYRSAKKAGVEVRVVFAGAEESEQGALREVMLAHVDDQVFGPDFDDADIVIEPDSWHMGLMNSEVDEGHLEGVLARLRGTGAGEAS